jgi:hypothetical protein
MCAGDPQTDMGVSCSLLVKKKASETYNKLSIRGEGEIRQLGLLLVGGLHGYVLGA